MARKVEGYVYSAFGKLDYLKYVFASLVTIRRYDTTRGIALFCSEEQKDFIEENNLTSYFDHIGILEKQYQSITGFKHNLHLFCPFEKNLFLDSDIVWLKNPDQLWQQFNGYGYAVTGTEIADSFFGGPKSAKVISDFVLQRRKRTLKHFNLTQLSRVQSGLIFIKDKYLAEKINEKAKYYLEQKSHTHFQSRKLEKGRVDESCEWSLAMSLSYHNLPIFPWQWGEQSPQLDFIEAYTVFNEDFTKVSCKFFFDQFVYSLRGLKTRLIHGFMMFVMWFIPGSLDYAWVTPYSLHFGWLHQKEPFIRFANKTWEEILAKKAN